ncbi:hypothetical protein OG463_00780 [Streptomyces xinghaiensis]|nr:hypothetical protein [Streptomyces sp. S07_1.15]WSQ70100.1 hypothetical protein OG463_00780 [Streptomyces xinghaiensis]
MSFNPLEQRGIPLDRQLRTWRELDVEPIDPDHTDPYTRCRIITMNGIEVEAILFSHQFARHCPDPQVKQQLARTHVSPGRAPPRCPSRDGPSAGAPPP